jgi:hypothetical protein
LISGGPFQIENHKSLHCYYSRFLLKPDQVLKVKLIAGSIILVRFSASVKTFRTLVGLVATILKALDTIKIIKFEVFK